MTRDATRDGSPPARAPAAGSTSGGKEDTMKRALLVGIDEYEHFRPLSGCANDVAAVQPLLARSDDGTLNFECRALTSASQAVTTDQLTREAHNLFAPGADVALLYFAG